MSISRADWIMAVLGALADSHPEMTVGEALEIIEHVDGNRKSVKGLAESYKRLSTTLSSSPVFPHPTAVTSAATQRKDMDEILKMVYEQAEHYRRQGRQSK